VKFAGVDRGKFCFSTAADPSGLCQTPFLFHGKREIFNQAVILTGRRRPFERHIHALSAPDLPHCLLSWMVSVFLEKESHDYCSRPTPGLDHSQPGNLYLPKWNIIIENSGWAKAFNYGPILTSTGPKLERAPGWPILSKLDWK